MTMDDIKKYGLENVTEKLKGIPPNKKGGPTGDYKRILEEMEYPWFQNKEWQRQLKLASSGESGLNSRLWRTSPSSSSRRSTCQKR